MVVLCASTWAQYASAQRHKHVTGHTDTYLHTYTSKNGFAHRVCPNTMNTFHQK